MAQGYQVENSLLKNTSQVLGASETDTIVSEVYRMSGMDSMHSLVRIVASSVTVGSGITANMQTSWDGGTTWEDIGTDVQIAISGNGSFQIELNYDDTNAGLAWPLCRIVVTTTAGSAITVDACYISRRL